MASSNSQLLLDLLAYHIRADVVATQKQIASLTDIQCVLDLLIKNERLRMVAVGNRAYMQDSYKDTRSMHSLLMTQKCQTILDLEWLNMDHAFSSDTLCNIEHLQHEARSSRGLE